MKKRIISMFVLIIILWTVSCQGASYTLPEKMYNQLSIGSGLKGTFTIHSEGEKFKSPFLDAITDAEWSIRGISSGSDLHYYVFQTGEQDQQSALSELCRKDGKYYFRSDMVQGKILAFPVLSQFLDSLFPANGSNGTSSSFVSKIMTLPENVRKDSWEPVLQRYQNELEMWLADFTVKADTIKMENGLSALDFSYEIPMDSVYAEIIRLYGEFSADPEVVALLSSVMSEDEKKIYLNSNLLYFYLEALQSLQLDRPVLMSKRVSAIGDLLRFRLELPLDERISGYQSMDIETINQITVVTLRNRDQIMVAAFPESEILKQPAFEQSVWFARISNNPEEKNDNIAVRMDIRKTNNTFEQDEKSHETDHYDLTIVQDTIYLPADTDLSVLSDFEPINVQIDLHYSSKYAQNSATTLEIAAEVNKADSTISFSGKLKTAAPWLFMPFDIIDPIQVGTDKEAVLNPYITDWISNAASMIHHSMTEEETVQSVNDTTEQRSEEPASSEKTTDEQHDTDAETAPIDLAVQE